MRSPACQYSFDDLHKACFGRVMTGQEKSDLYALSQAERNRVVEEWVAKAGWVTEDVTGEDGVLYRSFMSKN